MSDPLERLGRGLPESPPDIAGIKARAGRIQTRRRALVSGPAAAILAIALAGVALRPGTNDRQTSLAQSTASSASPPSDFSAAGTPNAESGAAAGAAGPSVPKSSTVERRDEGPPAEPAPE